MNDEMDDFAPSPARQSIWFDSGRAQRRRRAQAAAISHDADVRAAQRWLALVHSRSIGLTELVSATYQTFWVSLIIVRLDTSSSAAIGMNARALMAC